MTDPYNNDQLDIHENLYPIQLSSPDYIAELPKLDLDSFPVIDDFHIQLFDAGEPMGMHIRFISDLQGILIGFSWWDHVDQVIQRKDFSIPTGTLEHPFNDGDQSWQLLIWEHKDYVYMMKGKELQCTEFPVWIRIPKSLYYSEWKKLQDAK